MGMVVTWYETKMQIWCCVVVVLAILVHDTQCLPKRLPLSRMTIETSAEDNSEYASWVSHAGEATRVLLASLDAEMAADSHNISNAVGSLMAEKERLQADLVQVQGHTHRLNTTLAIHHSSQLSHLALTRAATATARTLRADMSAVRSKCDAQRNSLVDSAKAVNDAINQLLLVTGRESESLTQSLVQLVSSLHIGRPLSSGLPISELVQLSDNAISPNVTEILAAASGSDVEARRKMLDQLWLLLNNTLSDVKVQTVAHDRECFAQEYSFKLRLANATQDAHWQLLAAAQAEKNIDAIRKELEEVANLDKKLRASIDESDQFSQILQEGLHMRTDKQHELITTVGDVTSRIQLTLIKLGSHLTLNSSLSRDLFARLCLNPAGETCNGHGTCDQGKCVCARGFSGSDCNSRTLCPFPPPVVGGGRASSQSIIDCNDTAVDAVCVVRCEGGSSEVSHVIALTCLSSGAWDKKVPVCHPAECNVTSVIALVPPFSHVSCSGNLPGDKCAYSCVSGTTELQPKGTHHVTCLPDGQWSEIPQAVCEQVLCNRVPETIDNGFVNCSGCRHGDVCQYSCLEGFEVVGERVFVCRSDSSWSHPTAPRCTRVTCPQLPKVRRGLLECSGNKLGDTCDLKCDSGHYTSPFSTTRECLPSGAWSGVEVRACRPLECSTPPVATNGINLCPSGTKIGSKCEYSCRSGNPDTESAVLECTKGNFWKGDISGCAINKCSIPPEMSHGKVVCISRCLANKTTLPVGPTQADTECSISCDPGFELVGASVVTCAVPEGRYNVSSYCRPIACPAMAPLPNGKLICTGNIPGSKCQRVCDPGFQIAPENVEFSCSEEALWDPEHSISSALCVPVECGSLPAPRYGTFNCTGTSFGHMCSVVCPTGNVLEGSSDYLCDKRGQWSGSGVCVPGVCALPLAPPHASLACSGSAVGDECVSQCNRGFESVRGNSRRTCSPGGFWSGTQLECSLVVCERPAVLSRGSWECSRTFTTPTSLAAGNFSDDFTLANLPLFSRCRLTCGEGFRTEVADWVCDESGLWFPEGYSRQDVPKKLPEPQCTRATCNAPAYVANGEVKCAGSREQCAITCHDGFQLLGSQAEDRIVQCVQGVWRVGRQSRCVPVSCGIPPSVAPREGSVSCVAPFGSTEPKVAMGLTGMSSVSIVNTSCAYLCGKDLATANLFELICSVAGKWETNPRRGFPPCAAQCGTPAPPANAALECAPDMSECHVACSAGFDLVGESKMSCLDHVWSNVGECVPRSCGDPVLVQDAVMECDGTIQGSTCQYQCAAGFVVVGGVSVCDGGQWTGVPRCEPRPCTDDIHPLLARSCVQSNRRTICNAFCPTGYVLEGSEIRECGADGRFSGTTPTCVPVTCPKLARASDRHTNLMCDGHTFDNTCEQECGVSQRSVRVRCSHGGAWSNGAYSYCRDTSMALA